VGNPEQKIRFQYKVTLVGNPEQKIRFQYKVTLVGTSSYVNIRVIGYGIFTVTK
jgi:hypothetical protein